ncbi:MAG: hypothetical protein JWO15_3675 [Sphingomonadales bacterium]|nr:hypothetical protein [Sphingomonadales bacterium]
MVARDQTWDVLQDALNRIEYKRDVPPEYMPRFELERSDEENYAVLTIYTYNKNSYHEHRMRLTRHLFVVPVATYRFEAWVRWVFDNIAKIEMHETTEWFFMDGERIYAPHHGNGWDPYTFWPAHEYSEKFKAPGDA